MAFRALVLAFLMTMVASPSWAMGIMVHDARVQLSPIEGRPAAVYFMMMNHGDKADRLLSVTVDGADRAELHESSKRDGMMQMRKLESVTLGVDEAVMFSPGGKHIMVFGLKGVAPGDVVSLHLHFEEHGDVVMEAIAAAPGAKIGTGNDHMHH